MLGTSNRVNRTSSHSAVELDSPTKSCAGARPRQLDTETRRFQPRKPYTKTASAISEGRINTSPGPQARIRRIIYLGSGVGRRRYLVAAYALATAAANPAA